MTDAAQAVPLDHVFHVLPPRHAARLHALRDRGVHVECAMTDPDGPAPVRTWLVARVGARSVRTADHPWIAPALVHELVALTEPLL